MDSRALLYTQVITLRAEDFADETVRRLHQRQMHRNLAIRQPGSFLHWYYWYDPKVPGGISMQLTALDQEYRR